jgi:formate hydrogenlyase transcriptional activator
MRNPSDNWDELRDKVLGLGDTSVRKTHYPSLKQRLAELEQLTGELKRSQAYLAEAQTLSHTGSFGWKVSTGEHIWSEETYRIFELDPAVKPTMKQILDCIHPEDRAFVRLALERASESSQDFNYEHRLLMPDGRVKFLHVLAKAMRDSSGILEFAGAVMDITAAKQAEERIRQSEFYLSEGERLAHMGSWSFTPEGICDYWSPEEFSILGFDPAKGIPTIPEYLTAIHPDDREFMKRYIEGMIAEGRGCDVKYRTVHPVRGLRIMRSVGDAVIENGKAARFVGMTWDITEAERMTQELERSRAYLAEAQTLSHTGSVGWKIATGEHIWSEQTYRIFEFDPAVKPTSDLILERTHPQDRTLVIETLERASKGGQDFDFEHRLLMADGRVKYLHVLAKAIRDSSGGIEFVGAVMDVTAEKQANESLRQSEAELRQLIDAIPQQVFVFGPDWSPLFANRREREYTGLSSEEAHSKDAVARVFHPGDLKKLEVARERALSDGMPIEMEARIRRKDGQYRWFLIRDNPLRDEQGRILRWYGTRTDIEDRKRAEEMLRQSEAELQQILDGAPQHVAVLDTGGGRLFLNRAALDYHGLTLEEWQTSYKTGLFHPDDWERAYLEVHNAFSTGSEIEFEARTPRHDGVYRWFLFRYKPLRNEQGRITRWVVASSDIDDRKQAEERLHHENVALREEVDKASMFEEIVGSSPALRAVLSRVAKVAPTDSTVLITGETGTGKELIARAIHKRSLRSSRAFVSVNCSVIPRDLIASELFGHEKGAFTGATQRHLGRFELAEGGTIFLDEIGELPAETQVALLRVLQEREFERVGGNRTIRCEVRVIAATNRDIQAAVAAGTFRSDLFYRLNVFPIETPPLRKRKEDIPLLVEYFIDRYARKAGKSIRQVSRKSLELLQSYPWPGNIRELQNIVERSVIVCETESFSVDESWLSSQSPATDPKGPVGLSQLLAAQEKETIEAALRECGGRVSGPSGAAARLCMPRSTLESKIRSLKIDKNRLRIT